MGYTFVPYYKPPVFSSKQDSDNCSTWVIYTLAVVKGNREFKSESEGFFFGRKGEYRGFPHGKGLGSFVCCSGVGGREGGRRKSN